MRGFEKCQITFNNEVSVHELAESWTLVFEHAKQHACDIKALGEFAL
jgi:hypothetical protein